MKLYRSLAVAVIAVAGIFGGASSADAQLTSVLGDVLGNVVEGVFTKSNLSLNDVMGEWRSQGSAVSFKSDNLLQKAGGLATAGAVEGKLDSYYKKLGLDNAVLTINQDGTFTLKGKMTLSGTVKSNNDGTFVFNFQALKSISLGKVTAYVTKSGNNLNVMFDATKLKKLVSGIAGLTGISYAKAIASLLDSYEGMCVGFKMKKIGSVESTVPTTTTTNTNTNTNTINSTTKENAKSGASEIGGALFDILKGSGK